MQRCYQNQDKTHFLYASRICCCEAFGEISRIASGFVGQSEQHYLSLWRTNSNLLGKLVIDVSAFIQ